MWIHLGAGATLVVLGGIAGYEVPRQGDRLCIAAVERRPVGPIEQLITGMGSGDVSRASEESIKTWLDRHPVVVRALHKSCSEERKQGTASWGDSVDGRICAAVTTSEFHHYEAKDTQPSQTFGAGWK